ncbi:MAG: tetratricopeptide repeat protein, partial [Vicinamibacterales bacterium]
MQGRTALPAFLLALTAASAPAQGPHASHRVPSVPREILERPIALGAGIGAAHDAVSTRSARAQAFYNQGLAYLHSYAWIDAARSFNEALRLDATLAMAHVGLNQANDELNEPAAARAALDRARALAVDASAHDRRHIEIRTAQIAAGTDRGAFRAALDEALVALPADVELWLLRGMAESPDPADRGQGSTASSIRFYERALSIHPDHFAAHHYLTHAYENAGRIEDALEHAERYAQLAPAIPHAHHMRGHDLRRTGRIHEAIAAFRTAYDLETDPARAAGVPPEHDWHHQHNLDLLAASYSYIGQVRAAEPFLRRSFDLPSPLVIQAFNKHEWPAFLLSRGRAGDALAATGALTSSSAGVVRGVGHVMAGQALLALGRIAEAAEA